MNDLGQEAGEARLVLGKVKGFWLVAECAGGLADDEVVDTAAELLEAQLEDVELIEEREAVVDGHVPPRAPNAAARVRRPRACTLD